MEEQDLQRFVFDLCQDLNLDNQIGVDSLSNYRSLLKHYLLEGNQTHWLAISLFVNCKKNPKQNPISLTRLFRNLKDFHLIEFFDKLSKWVNMLNLPAYLQNDILNIEHEFNISSIIFDKYLNLFDQLFVCSKEKLVNYQFVNLRSEFQLNAKYKQKKVNFVYLYQFVWTIYSLLKTIYPLTSNDLMSSFHLLLSSNLFVYQLTKQAKLFHLLKETQSSDKLINEFSETNNCSLSMLNCLIEEHIKKVLFERIDLSEIDENKYFEIIRQINNQYDEIVLTNCFIDQRIFIENSSKFVDFLDQLNENRNQKLIQNKTPLTAQQHLTFFNSNSSQQQYLTPISQANQLIQLLTSIVSKSSNLLQYVGQQTYIDDLNQRLNDYEQIYLREFQSNDNDYSFQFNRHRFTFATKLFFVTLENIFYIENKRIHSNPHNNNNNSQIYQTFQKLILTNEFTKSLFSLCFLLVSYCYGDAKHDLNWILKFYSLNGYSLLKIIQIFLKSTREINQSRVLIKYLSTIEETILSSMIFERNSLLWNDIQTKGILPYKNLSSQCPSSPNSNLIQHFHQSPLSHQIKRRLFDNSTTTTTTTSVTRTQSDTTVDNSQRHPLKASPYMMFYKKFYRLVSQRIHLIYIRLFGNEQKHFLNQIWNLFLFLFEHHIEHLFKSRHLDQIILICFFYSFNSKLIDNHELTWTKLIQIYKTMPNANLHLTRSVFIRTIQQDNSSSPPPLLHHQSTTGNESICLTPSKPAGTIHQIDEQIFGDIKSFYEEIFLKIDSIEEKISNYFESNSLIQFPNQFHLNENQANHLSIHCGKNLFIDYSSKQIAKNLFDNADTNENQRQTNQSNSSNNILSSSIQVSQTNTVQTTTTRTFDGKFLTTISTSYQNKNPTNPSNQLNNQFQFGQTFKRTLSDQIISNSNQLNSLTKKVLQIENDRQLSSNQQ